MKKKCEHGYPIESEGKLPCKRTYSRFEICKDCAIKSSLRQLGDGIELTDEALAYLKKMLNK